MNEANSKKKFIKPEIKKVPLVAEEAVLASCKSNSKGNGPGGFMGLCQNGSMGSLSGPCSAYGS